MFAWRRSNRANDARNNPKQVLYRIRRTRPRKSSGVHASTWSMLQLGPIRWCVATTSMAAAIALETLAPMRGIYIWTYLWSMTFEPSAFPLRLRRGSFIIAIRQGAVVPSLFLVPTFVEDHSAKRYSRNRESQSSKWAGGLHASLVRTRGLGRPVHLVRT